MSYYGGVFLHHFRQWARAACDSWSYSEPRDDFFDRVQDRLTDSIAEWIGYGIQAGLLIEDGVHFNLCENAPEKGPYKWFSKRADAREPQCNWEYYVQVAHFVRLWSACKRTGSRLTFEDELMDLSVRRSGQLLWCIEVKEQKYQGEKLVANLISLGATGIDVSAPDRGNDPLRKAKYLVKHTPEFFSVVAIDWSRDFQVTYPLARRFGLSETQAPITTMHVPPSEQSLRSSSR